MHRYSKRETTVPEGPGFSGNKLIKFRSLGLGITNKYILLGFTHVTNSLATVTIRHLGVPQG